MASVEATARLISGRFEPQIKHAESDSDRERGRATRRVLTRSPSTSPHYFQEARRCRTRPTGFPTDVPPPLPLFEHLICPFDTHLTPNEANESEPERLGDRSAGARGREINFKANRGEWWRMRKMRLRSSMGLTLNQPVLGSESEGADLQSHFRVVSWFRPAEVGRLNQLT